MSEPGTPTREGTGPSPSSAAEKPRANWKARLRLGAIIAAIVVVLIVIFQNTEATETVFLWMRLTMPRWILLTLHFVAGVATGLGLSYYLRKRRTPPLTGR